MYTLRPREGVFAHARISPDGRTLVYASEQSDARHPNGIRTQETVVDLTTKQVLYTEEGIVAYWSTHGSRVIYSGNDGVSIRDVKTGDVARHIAPPGLGDYYSWARRDGKDLIMTLNSNDYYVKDGKAVLPYATVTFVDGNIVVRNIDNCENIVDTGIKGPRPTSRGMDATSRFTR